jgi:hypothetical protein
MFGKYPVTLGLLFLAAAPANGATLYKCKLDVTKNNHIIPAQLYIEHDSQTGQAQVMDPFINYYVGKPMDAEVSADNDKRLTVAWSFENIESREGQNIPRVRVRATVLKATHEAHVTVSFGNGDSESGFGACTVE